MRTLARVVRYHHSNCKRIALITATTAAVKLMDLILRTIRRQNQLQQKQPSLHHRVPSPTMVIIFNTVALKNSFSNFLLLFNFSFHFSNQTKNSDGKTNNVGTSPLPLTHTTQTTTSVASTPSHTKTTNAHHSVHDITSGCSRTIPISWNNSSLLQVCLCRACVQCSFFSSLFLSLHFNIFESFYWFLVFWHVFLPNVL